MKKNVVIMPISKSEIYKAALMALIAREENEQTAEMNEDDFCEAIYVLSNDYHWALESEKQATSAVSEASND